MNDNQVFEQAVAPHTRGLYAFIRHLNRWACDDIYQETMLAAWQGFHSLREQSSLRAWLYGMAADWRANDRTPICGCPPPCNA